MKMKLFAEALAKFLAGLILISLCIFLPAGTLDYPNGWLFISAMFIPILLLGTVLLVKNPALLEKRLRGNEKEEVQKKTVEASGLVFAASFILSALDYRLQLSYIPFRYSALGSAILLLSYGMYAFVLKENTYLSRTIEVQNGQRVIASGLYSRIRHPMYISTLIMFLSIPITLGSLIGEAVMLLYIPLLISRILNEERFLKDNLEGYEEYMGKVRYRLIPYIW